ncbi:MAG: hypothetical protein QM205_02585 [Bacillota bacterium]|jgi:DNA polymerase-3 subunit delta'|nr:hypothetical protein [Bacillota bacterium]HOF65194.1 hypothetical protein [Bacilli bacterium]HPK86317.1 hypothetical protein [Bacilli bacterium]
MDVSHYLKEYQKPLYKTFVNALTNNSLSHAYLIKGGSGTPLIEVATHLAKTLVCEKRNPLACDNCISCHRFSQGLNPDFIFLDGREGTIKISDIRNLETSFSSTAIEKGGTLIYVIHLVEKMTPEASNALLKFLEEPSQEIYAFLTTESEENVLPTILSRSQKLILSLLPSKLILQKCDEFNISRLHSEILVNFFNVAEIISEKVKDEEYLKIYDLIMNTLNTFNNNIKEGVLFIQTEVSKVFAYGAKTRDSARRYLELFTIFIKDLVNYKLNADITLKSYEPLIKDLSTKIENPEKILITFIESLTRLDSYVNIPLLFDHLAITIYKEGTDVR